MTGPESGSGAALPERGRRPRPWLIAAWPGMGNVAVIAAAHLIEQLGMTEVDQLPPDDHFDVEQVEVRDGLIVPAQLPRGVFFKWTNPGAGRDLIVFIGEAQPAAGSHGYSVKLLERAATMDVERVVTFASLASGLHPTENPKVSGAATDAKTLNELRLAEIDPVSNGQIGGLNGLVLGLAAERGMAGMCLLAEIPFFAMRIPNPKAARAALSVFSVLAGIDVNLESLNRQAAIVDRALVEAMEAMEARREGEAEPAGESAEDPEAATQAEAPEAPAPRPGLSAADRARIEALFENARKDSAQAVHLKSELDRLGVFREFEGRFLDLFRRAE